MVGWCFSLPLFHWNIVEMCIKHNKPNLNSASDVLVVISMESCCGQILSA